MEATGTTDNVRERKIGVSGGIFATVLPPCIPPDCPSGGPLPCPAAPCQALPRSSRLADLIDGPSLAWKGLNGLLNRRCVSPRRRGRGIRAERCPGGTRPHCRPSSSARLARLAGPRIPLLARPPWRRAGHRPAGAAVPSCLLTAPRSVSTPVPCVAPPSARNPRSIPSGPRSARNSRRRGRA